MAVMLLMFVAGLLTGQLIGGRLVERMHRINAEICALNREIIDEIGKREQTLRLYEIWHKENVERVQRIESWYANADQSHRMDVEAYARTAKALAEVLDVVSRDLPSERRSEVQTVLSSLPNFANVLEGDGA